jgi:hypothetical protein
MDWFVSLLALLAHVALAEGSGGDVDVEGLDCCSESLLTGVSKMVV